MDDDIYKISQIFLTPASILIGAFALPASEPLKMAMSIICIIIGLLWSVCIWNAWHPRAPLRKKLLLALPLLFTVLGLVFTIVHAMRSFTG